MQVAGTNYSAMRRVFTRTNLYTVVIVLLLFAVLPLSQSLRNAPDDSQLVVREVDLAPPPPPPPPQSERSGSSTGGVQGGLSLAAIPNAVRLLPLAVGSELGSGATDGLGIGGFDIGSNTNLTFSMEGVGFGTNGLDRTPVMLVRPIVPNAFMRRMGISQFDVELTVRLRSDGSLLLISIDFIEYPYPELEKLVSDAVPRIRYSRPTVDGQPVERVVRLPITINAR